MHLFQKKERPHKTTYFFLGLPIFYTKPNPTDLLLNLQKRIDKLEHCLPDITTLPPPRGLMRDVQLANLKILQIVADFCDKHKIRYWINYGTLLGAVRHGDFVPWDDDIDIGMLREDYEKIIKLFNQEMSASDLVVTRYSGRSGMSNMLKVRHKKIEELWIDIFPNDFYTQKVEDISEKIKLTQETRRITRKNRLIYKNQDVEAFHERLRNIHFKEILRGAAPAAEEQHPAVFTSCDYCHTPKYHFFHNYETIFPLKKISFCGHQFSCPHDADTYLTATYGDYMNYPKYMDNIHIDINKMSFATIMALKKFIKEENAA